MVAICSFSLLPNIQTNKQTSPAGTCPCGVSALILLLSTYTFPFTFYLPTFEQKIWSVAWVGEWYGGGAAGAGLPPVPSGPLVYWDLSSPSALVSPCQLSGKGSLGDTR